MKDFFKKDPSRLTLVLILLVLGGIVASHIPHKIISWDIFGYYLYLPFTFIYHDPGLRDFSVLQSLMDQYQNTTWFYQAIPQEGGHWVMKYPMGMAVLYFPWFVMGHLAALAGLGTPDGFSAPYQLSLLYGSFVYTALGLVFFHKSMRFFFNPAITSLLLLIIVFGTNYLVLTVFHGQGLMSHNYLFTLFAMLLWFTIRWHEHPSNRRALMIGILAGLAALSRPTEILVAAVPFLWGISDKTGFLRKSKLLWQNRFQLLFAILPVMLAGGAQLVYFKLMTGRFLYNSYGANAGEGMEFFHPYIWQVLFSFRKGWLVYTPVMIFALIGFVHLYKQLRDYFWSIWLFFLLSFYVIASWSCWWYADCYSQRALIPAYVFLALPMGSFLQSVRRFRNFGCFAIAAILLLLVVLNLFQSRQFLKGIIHSSRMTKPYYEAVFLKNRIPPGADSLLLIDRSLPAEKILKQRNHRVEKLVFLDFDSDESEAPAHVLKGAHGDVVALTAANPFSPFVDIPYHRMNLGEYGILRVRARIFVSEPPGIEPFSLTATFMHNGYPYYYSYKDPVPEALQINDWNEIELYYLTPEVRRPDDIFRATVWYRGSHTLYLDELQIELLKPLNR